MGPQTVWLLYLLLCSAERNSYSFGTTWGWLNHERIFILRWITPLMYTQVLIYQTCLFLPFLSFSLTCYMHSWGSDTHFSTIVCPRNMKMTLRTSFWRIQGLAKRRIYVSCHKMGTCHYTFFFRLLWAFQLIFKQ